MKELSTFVLQDESHQLVRKSQEERVKAIIERDWDEFTKTKEYAIKNMEKLRGTLVPIEVGSIQNLPNHNCIIINDLLLVSYTEVKEMIMDLKQKEKEHDRV